MQWVIKDQRVSRLKLRLGSNGGAGQPTNRGIERCTGTYVALADGDDYMDRTMLQKLVREAESRRLDLTLCNFQKVDANLKKIRAYDQKSWNSLVKNQQGADGGSSWNKNLLVSRKHADLFRISPVPWRKLYRREFIESNNIRFPEGDYVFEDNAFHWYNIMHAKRIGLVDEVS
jgi:glycosyltransferase involved in cell wall biosynthesis